MDIRENVSLKTYNTFGVDARARYFVEVHSTEELQEVVRQWPGERPFILGGGSNLLLSRIKSFFSLGAQDTDNDNP